MKKQFTKKWGYMLRKTNYPNVYETEKGGFVVRGRVTIHGIQKDKTKSFPNAQGPVQALALFEQYKESLMFEAPQVKQVPSLAGYAKAHFESKLTRGKIKAKSGKDKWRYRLPHILGGDSKEKDGVTYVVQGLGDHCLTDIRPHVEDFLDGYSGMVSADIYSPVTINGWLDVMRTMSRAASLEYEIPDFMSGVEDLQLLKKHKTYTVKAPNKIPVKDVPRFLALVREHWPQHYAMILLGMITGLRPSSLRPLRRTGPFDDDGPDIDWETGVIQVRRSMTGQEIMDTTKTGIEYPIPLPLGVIADLKWHVSQLSEVQLTSDLLFPSEVGGHRSDSVLRKCFEDISERMALGYRITPRAMRRTFNDIARRAGVQGLAARSISGHQTEDMGDWYSTLEEDERLAAVTQIYATAFGGMAA